MASITKEDFESFVASFADDAASGTFRNGFVLYLLSKHSQNVNFASSELDMYFQRSDSTYISNQIAVYRNMKSLITKVSKYKKSLNTYWHHIQRLFEEPAIVPQKRKRPSPAADIVPATPHEIENLSPPLSKKLRSDCDKCLSTKEECSSKYQILESKLKEVQIKFNIVSRKHKVKSVNRCNKRMYKRIEKLKKENIDLKIRISEMQHFNDNIDVRPQKEHTTLNNVVERLHGQMKKLRNKVKVCEKEKRWLKAEIERLTMPLSYKGGIVKLLQP